MDNNQKRFYNRNRSGKTLRPGFVTIDSISKPNQYTDFIDNLKLEQEQSVYKKPDVLHETHHIIPLSHNGPDTEENTILITFDQHKQAHAIIALVSGNIEDKQVADMMSGKTDEALLQSQRKKAAYSSHIAQKEKKTGRFSSTFQSERGKLSALAPSSIAFSREKAVNLGRISKKNKEFSFETRFTLFLKKREIFSIQRCWSSKDILNVMARIDPVIKEKAISKNFRITRIVQSSSSTVFSWSCTKVGEGVKDSVENTSLKFDKICDILGNATYKSPYEIYGEIGLPE